MRLSHLLLGLSLAAGCAGTVSVESDPPPPREEVVVARPGYVFVHGHWDRNGGAWAWRGGHYERERVGSIWIDGTWERRGSRRVWVEGHWRANG
ncbi:MAG TPA: hypothetical protein VGM88_24670 [Kofleriaceae bacterium]|jgi:hypothetical protein